MKRGTLLLNTGNNEEMDVEQETAENLLSIGQKRFFAVLIPIAFILDVIAMSVFDLTGGDATALIGEPLFLFYCCLVWLLINQRV